MANIKKQLVTQAGISLILVPCWWDGAVNRYFNI